MKTKYLPIFFFSACFFIFCQVDSSSANQRETPVVKIVREYASAVVNISTEKLVLLQENPAWGPYGNEMDAFYRQFYGAMAPVHALKLKSAGSGVILDKEGIIITNAHVVNMTTSIFVILNDGTEVPGKVMFESSEGDLAIIKIEPPKPLTEVALGKTSDLMIGETAIAIGNPLGLENSVSAGVVSGKNRTIFDQNGRPLMTGLIQTDTPINPGNSGGALFNLDGELIGINTAVIQNSQSIGFSIPVEKVKDTLTAYKQNKNVSVKYKRVLIPSQKVGMQAHSKNAITMKDLEDKGTHYLVKLDIKDLDKNKVDIEINGNVMTLKGERKEESLDQTHGAAMKIQSISSFARSMRIPDDVNPQGVTTQIKDDTLYVILPKKK